MTPGRWELVRGMAYPTMALVIGDQREQWVNLGPSGWWIRFRYESWRPARPGEVPDKVREALLAEQGRRSA